MPKKKIHVEQITNGPKDTSRSATIKICHGMSLLYFASWLTVWTIFVTFPSSMNPWILLISAAATSLVGVLPSLASHAISSRTDVTQLENARSTVHVSGLAHVKISVESNITFLFAIVASLTLQISFLSARETFPSWSGDSSTAVFGGTYAMSVLLFGLATEQAVRFLVWDVYPLYSIPFLDDE